MNLIKQKGEILKISILVHHLLIFTSAKMSDHHVLTQPAVDLYSILVRNVLFFCLLSTDCSHFYLSRPSKLR